MHLLFLSDFYNNLLYKCTLIFGRDKQLVHYKNAVFLLKFHVKEKS